LVRVVGREDGHRLVTMADAIAAVRDGFAAAQPGALASGRLPGRTSEDELTVAGLAGLGIQDAAIAALLTRRAGQRGAGRDLPLGES
jgi:alanine dehydrogenase